MAGIEIDGVNNKIDLDDDKDTSISANVDDTLVVEVGGATKATITSSQATFTQTGDTDVFIIESTSATAETSPDLVLFRNSSSPADADTGGNIIFRGRNDNSQDVDYNSVTAACVDVSDGSESGRLEFATIVAGNSREMMRFQAIGSAGSDTSEVVINEGSADINFRVETNGNENAIKVDGGTDTVRLGTSSDFGTFLNISGGSTHDIGIENSTGNKSQIIAKNNSSSHNTQMLILQSIRTSTAAFEYFRFICNDGADVDMLADGNGNFKIDGTVTPGGVDYAEFFEWKDGNDESEDRRGHSVILDGDKILVATNNDDPSKIIGIVSTNPSVLGGGDLEKWVHKYERDDYDSLVWEEHTVTEWTDEDGKKHSYQTDKIPNDLSVPSDAIVISEEEDKYGNTVKLKRKKLNPEWDSNKQYISREDRKEWETIGLMGKLRLKKGEPTNPNWIKLRDISETVEEWLVR